MDKILHETLDNLDEGIVILDKDLKVVFWNNQLELWTKIHRENILECPVYEVIPGFDKGYFHKIMQAALREGRKMFLSAAMHKDLLRIGKNVNLKISRLEKNLGDYILLEFIDVTNQFVRISQLKRYVKELKEKEKTIHMLAYHDGLTGLPNRNLFYKIAAKFCDNALRSKSLLGLMFIDVDKFKQINDTYGHKKGDEILIFVAEILKKSTRTGDVVARFGGDEFLILLPTIKSFDDCDVVANRIQENINHPSEPFSISLSIGISILPADGETIDQLTVEADRVMYNIKSRGGNGYDKAHHRG